MTPEIELRVAEDDEPVQLRAVDFVRGGGGGTTDYDELENKPSINGVTLEGNSSASDLSLASASDVAAKYTKPSGGIPKSDLASAVRTSLGKADSAYQKPSGGIPASDLAAGVIPDDEIFYCTYGTTTSAQIEAAYQAGKIVACKYSDRVYYLGYRGSETAHGFYCVIDGTSLTTVYRVYCNNGMWSNSSHSVIRKPSSASSGNVLKYDGSDWTAAALTATDVGAIEKPSSASDGDFLTYNASTGAWVATTVPSASGVSF